MVLVFLFHAWYWNALIRLLCKELSRFFHFGLFLIFVSSLNLAKLSVEILFSLGKAISLLFGNHRSGVSDHWCTSVALREAVFLFTQFLGLDSFSDGYLMSI